MIFYNDIFESKERKRKEYSIQRKIRQTILESRSSSRLEEEAEYDEMIGKLKSSFGAVNGKKAIYKIIKRFRYRQPELLYWNEKEKQSHFQEK